MSVLPTLLDKVPPQDYVFATGTKTSVQEFLRLAAEAAGFSPAFDGEGVDMICRDTKSKRTLATVSPQYFRPFDTPPLIGNPDRLKQATGFKGSRSVARLAEDLIKVDIHRRKIGALHV